MNQATEPQQNATSLEAVVPVVLFTIGAALTAGVLMADLVGLAALMGDGGSRKPVAIGIGLALMLIGAVVDLTYGRRRVVQWLKAAVSDWTGLFKFLAIGVQLSFLVVIVRMTFLESNAFYNSVMLLTLYGFVINYFLPASYRLPFVVLLSLGGVFGIFGPSDGGWIVANAIVLIGICHLPVPIWLRASMLSMAGLALIAMRAGYLTTPWTNAIWPLLGSMFMFRMVVYFYDLRHKMAPVSIAHSLSYFLMLPNLAFPLFPVVDHSTFCRTYYNDDQYRIYQRGLHWMFMGVLHLLLYRYINYYWVIGPESVNSTGTLLQYMVTNYLFIVRVSGQFQIAIGILHLFGFNLPRVMDRFLLAEGFADYWRRVNVYWKEFIQKVFFLPAYVQLRTFGPTSRLVLATGVAFAVTWFFHAYQWFWLRGSFRVAGPDIMFWVLMGVLVLANSLYEMKHGRRPVKLKRAASWSETARRTLRVAGTFVVVIVLWSLWISSSFEEWFTMLADAQVTWLGLLGAVVAIVGGLGVILSIYDTWPVLTKNVGDKGDSFSRMAAPVAVGIILLCLLVQPQLYFRLGPKASYLISDLRTNRLNERDEDLVQRGYYENLVNVRAFTSELGDAYAQKPDDWEPLVETDAVRFTNDLLRYELLPNLDGSFKTAKFTTNRWGMRDQDYEQLPPPDTYRIALLGGSVEQGSGVILEESFEYLVEKRLNRDKPNPKYSRYEILNFSVGGYRILQQVVTLERKAVNFKPHVLFYVAHPTEDGRLFTESKSAPELVDPQQIPYDGLRDILERAGVDRPLRTRRVRQQMEPFRDDVKLWALSHMAQVCRENNILPVLVVLGNVSFEKNEELSAPLLRIGEQAGFIVLDLADVYDEARANGVYLKVAPWDNHPNPRGHGLIAERLYLELQKNQHKFPPELALGGSNAPASKIP